MPVAAAVRGRVPRRPPDRRRARAGRRHRDHRPRRRRVALPRAARVRARLGVGRLGPPRRGHPRRPPARVLRAEPGRQLLGRLVGAPPPLGPSLSDGAGRRRRHRGDHEARELRGPRQHRHACGTSCSTRCTIPRATCRPTSSPTSRRRTSTIFPAIEVRITGVRGTPATDTYKLLLAYHAGWAGEVRVAFSWPDAYEKAKATAAILAKRVEMAGPRGRGVAHRVLGCRRARRADRAARGRRCTAARAARVRAARRVALRRPAHRGHGRSRARAAHPVGAARGHDGCGRRRSRWRDRAARDLADADRQAARRRAGARDASRRCADAATPAARALRLPRGRQGRHRQRRDLRRRRRHVRADRRARSRPSG